MSFTFTSCQTLPEVLEITGRKFGDERGFFSESFRYSDFKKAGIPPLVQENHSYSKGGTFRGLHYQLNPKAQGKLVYCVSGLIEDFVVDIRKNSPTYGKYAKFVLHASEPAHIRMVYVPPGFAHGFYVPGVNTAHVIYKVSEYWAPEHERAIRYDDPDIGLGLEDEHIRISDKDRDAPLLRDAENNFVY